MAAALLAVALAGCSAGRARVSSEVHPAPVNANMSKSDIAFDLLMNGEEKAAQRQLKAVLKRDPMNADARLLSDSIARDPKELLGPQSYAYTARAGDTVVGLAQRFLGSRLKAYQLLRYNGLKAPAILVAGQIVQIPGEVPRVEPARRPEVPPARPTAATPTPKPKPLPSRSAAPAASPATGRPANPAAARQLRGAGLAALNQGNVQRAVVLLRRAATLDPGNALIARDLARAERIDATVKARR